MNHSCHGDYWPTLGIYRCLADGTMLNCVPLPYECPNCGRKVEAVVVEGDPRTRTITEIEGQNGSWYPMPSPEIAADRGSK